jgi:hypothetical protein
MSLLVAASRFSSQTSYAYLPVLKAVGGLKSVGLMSTDIS